jgi:hypothetical protein
MKREDMRLPWQVGDFIFMCPTCQTDVSFEDWEIELILTAVNNHHALIDALKATLKEADDSGYMGHGEVVEYSELIKKCEKLNGENEK